MSNDSNFEECPPRPDAIIQSLRAFGYDLGMATADLIDNSISAKAKLVKIEYSWNDGEPWIRILDDGEGMDEGSLTEAMRLGTKSPLEARAADDLGRFGLGLKTASFSQCSYVSVFSKVRGQEINSRFWDLDVVENSKKWNLGITPCSRTVELSSPLREMDSGTVVVWQKLDRMNDAFDQETENAEDAFYRKFLFVKDYTEAVFHRFLEQPGKPLKIEVGQHDCKAWDPFLRKNVFTQELSSETYSDSRVSITPYILPHVSKRSAEESAKGSGLRGWTAQQGFYLYRNRRLIVLGGYLDFDLKPEEHYKLARIQVDITNDMDMNWRIDVRKAVAIPPDNLRRELFRILRATRSAAAEVYRARLGRKRRTVKRQSRQDIWMKIQRDNKVVYQINSDNPVIKEILNEIEPPYRWTRKLFHALASTVPHQLIMLNQSEIEDCHTDIPDDLHKPPEELVGLCELMYFSQKEQGRSHNEAVDIVCSIEPFDTHPVFRARLDSLGDGLNDRCL